MKPLPQGLTIEDWEISATIRDLDQLDKTLDQLKGIAGGQQMERLVDLGCGIGGLTWYVAERLGISERVGVDADTARLERAAQRGIRTLNVDLNSEAVPLEDASVSVATTFGAFEHVVFYDNMVRETARLVADDGWFIISMPNLGSYLNRLMLLAGYQPREVEVSLEVAAGIHPVYRSAPSKGVPLGHLHTATLRCMRELLNHYEFDVVDVVSFAPDFESRLLLMVDKLVSRLPSWSRRFIILARRRRRVGTT